MAMEYEVIMDQNHLDMKMFMPSRFNGKITQQWKHLTDLIRQDSKEYVVNFTL